MLLWLPVILPLLAGAVALRVGLPYRDWDWITIALLLLGSWGAAVGLFSGWVLAGMGLGRALIRLGMLVMLGPAGTAVLTTALAVPLGTMAFLLDAPAERLVVIAMTCWYLVAAGAGVELLDRYLRHPTS